MKSMLFKTLVFLVICTLAVCIDLQSKIFTKRLRRISRRQEESSETRTECQNYCEDLYRSEGPWKETCEEMACDEDERDCLNDCEDPDVGFDVFREALRPFHESGIFGQAVDKYYLNKRPIGSALFG